MAELGAPVFALTACTPAHADDTPIGATTVGGKIFLDATYPNQYKNGKRTALSRNGQDLKRFYIKVDHRFSGVWSAHLTTDMNWTRNESPTAYGSSAPTCRAPSTRRWCCGWARRTSRGSAL